MQRMTMNRMASNRMTLLAVGLLAALAGCGGGAPASGDGKSGDDAGARSRSGIRAVRRRPAPVVKHDTVAAVPLGKPGAPVDLRFDLNERPRVGRALQITLEITPRAAVDRVQLRVEANENLSTRRVWFALSGSARAS